MVHLKTTVFLLTTVAAFGCVKARNIQQPVPEAIEVTLPDSVRYVIDAAESAITDEGIGIELSDRKRGLVESAFIDIGQVRAMADRSTYHPDERNVRFRFWTRPTFGGTRLFAEVVFNQFLGTDGGRAMEKMVPSDHAGREVVTRMLAKIQLRLREQRDKRKIEGQGTSPPAS